MIVHDLHVWLASRRSPLIRIYKVWLYENQAYPLLDALSKSACNTGLINLGEYLGLSTDWEENYLKLYHTIREAEGYISEFDSRLVEWKKKYVVRPILDELARRGLS